MYEGKYDDARAEFAKASAMTGLTDPQKAEIQLYVGLSYYETGDYEHAKPELLKVVDMPGAGTRPAWDGGRMGYVPAREAMLRLRLRNLIKDDQKILKVLFIGSSHTLRGDIPEMVTKIAASAPPEQPHIIAGDFVRMGTALPTFWNAGDTSDTARGVIASEPWDAIVFETFYSMKPDDCTKYGKPMVELIRSKKAKPVIYESPIQKAAPYPEEFQKFHDMNMSFVKDLDVPIAPSVLAWMKYLGQKPTEAQLGYLYDDWIHASPKGAYMTACCVYAALTGCSPVGLYRPSNIPEAEADVLQKIAWDAVQESNKK